MDNESSPKTVITLVHGTWAPDALWTRPTSKLRKTLLKSIPRVEFKLARWSGVNSPAGRRKGGDKVRSRLLQLITKDYPKADHYVIAHSHGGNVVRYALKGITPETKQRISAVICLSTPFISCKKRDLRDRVARIKRDVLQNKDVFLFGAILLSSVVIEKFFVHETYLMKILGSTILAIYAVFWFGDFWRGPLAKRIEAWLYERQEATLSRFRFSEAPNPPLLSLSPCRDEASWWLNLVGKIAAMPFALRRVYLGCCFALGAGLALWFQAIKPGIAVGKNLLDLNFDNLFFYIFTIMLGGAVGVFLGFLFAEALRWLIPNLTQGRFFGLGRSPGYIHFVAEIRTDELPAEFDQRQDKKVDVRVHWWQLRHSAIYETDAALEKIVERINTI